MYLKVLFLLIFTFQLCCAAQASDAFSEKQLARTQRHVPKKIQDSLKKFLRKHQSDNTGDFLDMLIPKNLPIPPFNISYDSGLTSMKGKFTDVFVYGLQDIQVDDFSTDFVNMEVEVAVKFSNLTIKGQYHLETVAGWWENKYSGDFTLEAENLKASGNAYLNVTNSTLQVGDIDIDLTVNDTNIEFENLLGGGILSSFSNGVINQLSGMIFDSAKGEILDVVKQTVREKLDKQLSKIPKSDFIGGKANKNAPIDYMLQAAATRMQSDGLDPLRIPFIRKTFKKKVIFMNVEGELRIDEGILKGLSTIHRTGDIELGLENGYLNLVANMGFDRLSGSCAWLVRVMGLKKSGLADIVVDKVSISVSMNQEMVRGSHPKIQKLKITDLGQIWIDLRGLGTLEFVVENILNLMTNSLKATIARKIEKEVKKELEKELQKISLPF